MEKGNSIYSGNRREVSNCEKRKKLENRGVIFYGVGTAVAAAGTVAAVVIGESLAVSQTVVEGIAKVGGILTAGGTLFTYFEMTRNSQGKR